jgi:gluconokinase
VAYDELKIRVLDGNASDEQLLAWAEQRGGTRGDDECEIWNVFMMKRGWRDAAAPLLAQRIRESGFEARTVLTIFDHIDFDEGRDPVSARAWEPRG